MCGIVGGFDFDNLDDGVAVLRHRGPDAEGVARIGTACFGHTRLAILDLDHRSDQPFRRGDLMLTFNGEIWNHDDLRNELIMLGHRFTTTGDTEVLAAALSQWGESALQKIDGMFAFAWTVDGKTIRLARDPFGEVPVHWCNRPRFCFASEVKGLMAMGVDPSAVRMLAPGHVLSATRTAVSIRRYYDVPCEAVSGDGLELASARVFALLGEGTAKKTISDVPVCTLLSGGIDSSSVLLFLRQQIPGIVAYTAVYEERSRDLRAARLVAENLNVPLHEIKVPSPTADDLSGVVRVIEMPYKAQVEIGWPCLKLAQAMRSDGFRVTFSGEGSDELWASYGFAYHALKSRDWHLYRKELFLSQARKNFARCNKVFMAHGIECRLPFLHKPLVEYAVSLPQGSVQSGKSRPKAVLQDGFSGLLPDEVTRRPKTAFQDGMGIKREIENVLSNPQLFYRAEHAKNFGRMAA